jgi:hypothetical protein
MLMVARYIACLRERIDSLPTRQGRRSLNADAARHIVSLKSPKFTAILDELSRRWGQTIPDAMVNEEPTHSMLLALEDAMFSKYDPWTNTQPAKVTLDWGGDKESDQSKDLPLPIIGLDYTLRLYFPTSAIDLSSITDLDLSSRNLTGMSLGFRVKIDYERFLHGFEKWSACSVSRLMRLVSLHGLLGFGLQQISSQSLPLTIPYPKSGLELMAYLRFLISQISRLPKYDNSSMREGIGQIYSTYPLIYLRRSSKFPNRFRPTSQDQLLKSAGSWKRGNSYASL